MVAVVEIRVLFCFISWWLLMRTWDITSLTRAALLAMRDESVLSYIKASLIFAFLFASTHTGPKYIINKNIWNNVLFYKCCYYYAAFGSICPCNRAGLVCNHLLLRDFGLYGIVFMDVCANIIVVMVMLFRDFGPYGIIVVYVLCNYCHDNAVQGFWTLRYNSCVCAV
jgi:hypothetical protein